MTDATLIRSTQQVILDYEHPVYNTLYPRGSARITISFTQYLAWLLVVRYLSQNGLCFTRLNPAQKWQAYLLCDGFGKLGHAALADIGWDWSHVRDSSYEALCEVAEYIYRNCLNHEPGNSFSEMVAWYYDHAKSNAENPLNLFGGDNIYDNLTVTDTNEATFSIVLTGTVETPDAKNLVPALRQCLGDWDAGQLEQLSNPIVLKDQITLEEAQSLKTYFSKYGAVTEIKDAAA